MYTFNRRKNVCRAVIVIEIGFVLKELAGSHLDSCDGNLRLKYT
jgi:hypothetical protein